MARNTTRLQYERKMGNLVSNIREILQKMNTEPKPDYYLGVGGKRALEYHS